MHTWSYVVVPLVALALGAVITVEGWYSDRRWRRQAEEERRRAGAPAE